MEVVQAGEEYKEKKETNRRGTIFWKISPRRTLSGVDSSLSSNLADRFSRQKRIIGEEERERERRRRRERLR